MVFNLRRRHRSQILILVVGMLALMWTFQSIIGITGIKDGIKTQQQQVVVASSIEREMHGAKFEIIDMELIQMSRKKTLQETCHRYSKNKEEYTPDIEECHRQIFVDDLRSYMFCSIPKVASTNWKSTMTLLSNGTTQQQLKKFQKKHGAERNPTAFAHNNGFLRKTGISKLNDFDEKEISYRLDNYIKFMFVRHPFQRLLSAFIDKFVLNDTLAKNFHKAYGTKIIKLYRKHASKSAIKSGDGVKFEEFIQYLANTPLKKVQTLNSHWQTFSYACCPCQIDYDYIGHYETLSKDANYILSDIAPDLKNTTSLFPDKLNGPTSKRYNYSTDMDSVKKYISQLPAGLLAKLIRIYAKDFDMHGYSPIFV